MAHSVCQTGFLIPTTNCCTCPAMTTVSCRTTSWRGPRTTHSWAGCSRLRCCTRHSRETSWTPRAPSCTPVCCESWGMTPRRPGPLAWTYPASVVCAWCPPTGSTPPTGIQRAPPPTGPQLGATGCTHGTWGGKLDLPGCPLPRPPCPRRHRARQGASQGVGGTHGTPGLPVGGRQCCPWVRR